MDPTTQAHIDPSTFSSSTTPGGTPSLTTKPSATTAQQDAHPAVTGLRQRVNKLSETVDSATDHPAVKDAKKAANQQVHQLREFLGKSPAVLRLEKQTGVDRVLLVVGGILLYFIIIPLNFLGLAQPATTLLTFIPPMLLSARVLDRPDENKTKLLLSYYVVFGFVQFAESLMAGFLARRIPQYYTVKLIFLAYLIHPRTKGALKFHQSVLQPALAMAPSSSSSRGSMATPPTTKGADSHSGSPTSAGYTAKVPSATAFSPSGTAPSAHTGGFTNATGSTGSTGSGVGSLNTAPSSATTSSTFGAPGEFSQPTTGAEKSAGLGETTVPAQQGSVVPPSLGSGGITLPSGGGSGVGLEIPKEPVHPSMTSSTNVPY